MCVCVFVCVCVCVCVCAYLAHLPPGYLDPFQVLQHRFACDCLSEGKESGLQ